MTPEADAPRAPARPGDGPGPGLRWPGPTEDRRPAATGRRPAGSRRRHSPPSAAARSRALPGSVGRRRRRRRSSIGCSASSRGSSSSSSSDSGSGRPVRITSPEAATCSWLPRIAAGWIRSWSCTRSRPSRAPGSSAADHRPSRRAGASGSSTGSAACCRSGAAGSGSSSTWPSARAVIANGAVFAQMPEGTVSGPPGRIGPFRTGWAVIAMRTDAPIVPLAIAGTEELYLGRRLASQVLPATSARALAGLPPDAPFPPEGSREELDARASDERRPGGAPRSGGRGAPPVDRRSAGASATPPPAADLAAAPAGPSRPRRLSPSRPPPHGILAPMQYAESILDLVGGTPLVRISRLTRDLGPA